MTDEFRKHDFRVTSLAKDPPFSVEGDSLNQNDKQTEDQDIVARWQLHPRQALVGPHHALTQVERRRPENAQIRRWMNLADKALESVGGTEDPTGDSEPRNAAETWTKNESR